MILVRKMLLLCGVAGLALAALSGNAQPQAEFQVATPPPGPGATPGPVAVSPAAAEVIRLAQSGVGDDVVLAYIQNSAGGFELTAEQILYARDIGLSSQVITAMLSRDAAARSQPPTAQPTPEPAQPSAPAPTVPVEAPLTPLPTESTTPPPQVNYFYSDLAPYGSWVDLAGIGWCWQPTVVVVNRGWQPYCDRGHWLYCSSGWYWQSEYSWGWAPFHYGRWQLHPRCGWVWSPDAVWGPAWVTWRTVGNNCGWAPLPPHAVFQTGVGWCFNGVAVSATFGFGLQANCFTFVGLNNFNNRDLSHARLAPVEVTKIYNHTTIINNYTVNNTTVINHGIPVERVSAVATTPVHRATVREATVGSGRTITTTQASDKGETVVYRSQLKAPVRSAPVVVQKVDDRHPVIRHTPTVQVAAPRNPTYSGGARQSYQQPAGSSYGNAANRPGYPTQGQQAPRTPQSAPTTPNYPYQAAPRQRSAEVQTDSRSAENNTRAYPEPSDSRSGNQNVYSPKGHEQQGQPVRQSPQTRQNSSSHSQPANTGNSNSKSGGS